MRLYKKCISLMKSRIRDLRKPPRSCDISLYCADGIFICTEDPKTQYANADFSYTLLQNSLHLDSVMKFGTWAVSGRENNNTLKSENDGFVSLRAKIVEVVYRRRRIG